MTDNEFKKGLENAFLKVGFARSGKVLRRDGDRISTLIGFEKGFGDQWFISVGFWLHALGSDVPNLVEKTHLYFRLERIFPQFRDLILTAGCVTDAHQPEAYSDLLKLVDSDIEQTLRSMESEDGLRGAMKTNVLTVGLVRKEARQYLAAL